jgi:hypothetical protein
MSECEHDELVVRPTRGGIDRVDEGDEVAHKQTCPGERCGFALMLVRIEICDEGDRDLTIRWRVGEGAPSYMEDASKAVTVVNEFAEEEQEERIEPQLDTIRRERQESN